MIKVQSLIFFQNIFLQHASSVVQNFENHLSSHNCGSILFSRASLMRVYFHQHFFLNVASSETFIQRCSLMEYGAFIRFSFEIAVLNIFGKLLEKHQLQSSYSAWLWAFNMCSVVNDLLRISWKFSEQLFQRTQVAGHFWFHLIIP